MLYEVITLVGGPQQKFADMSLLASSKGLNGLMIGVSEEGNRLEDLAKCYRQASRNNFV